MKNIIIVLIICMQACAYPGYKPNKHPQQPRPHHLSKVPKPILLVVNGDKKLFNADKVSKKELVRLRNYLNSWIKYRRAQKL